MKNGKYIDCPPDKLGYEVDCALKQALKRLFNDHPSNFAIKNVELTDRVPMVDPSTTRNVFSGIKLELELVGEYYFELNGKLRKMG